ncbi:GGDEF domain-containing protein [Brevundimonas lutea]|uniref:GGDEF domain-containing protein n=1 Tax=Brevundimonas lutea TaxID=2293980 RepID=UPI001F0C1B15|nr:GGDEF domain-containing protein [Brevundimonas lutea]
MTTLDVTGTAELERLRAEVAALRARTAELEARAVTAEALADHDVLTPTLNRRGFVEVLKRTMAYCARHQVEAVLLYLDLDGFKGVNDTLGHAAGDAALIKVAGLLSENVRESDAVGRLGGDEFALVMLNAGLEQGRDKARLLTERMASEPFEWEGRTASLGGAFGIRAYVGQDDPETWLAEADAAMWVRKRGAR